MQINERSQRLFGKLLQDLGPLIIQSLKDDAITEIMLNPDGNLWVDDVNTGQRKIGELNESEANTILFDVAGLHHLVVSATSPRLEAQLPNYFPMTGERFTGQVPPIVMRPTFTIRKRARTVFSLNDYVTSHRLSISDYEILKDALINRKNILVCGGPGSGKTTFTNALIQLAVQQNPELRFLLLEDVPELQCQGVNTVSMLTTQTVSMRDLLKSAMRMRPDRILIGEVRGSEALDMLKAWNTGCPGGICTVHANGVDEALQRIADLSLEAGITHPPTSLINHTIDLVVFVTRHLHQSGFIRAILSPQKQEISQ